MGGLAAASALAPAVAHALTPAALPSSDLDILNFALTLEYVERTCYEQAVAHVPFEQDLVYPLAVTLRADEAKHTATLSDLISTSGGTPVKRAAYSVGNAFRTPSDFLKLSQALEDTGVHADLGQAGNIKTPQVLFAAAIMTVEARHAGAMMTSTVCSRRWRSSTTGTACSGCARSPVHYLSRNAVSSGAGHTTSCSRPHR